MVYSYTSAGSEFMDQYMEHTIEKLETSGEDQAVIDEEIENMTKMMEAYENPLIRIGVTFVEIFPVGLLITLICAAILKKKSDKTAALDDI